MTTDALGARISEPGETYSESNDPVVVGVDSTTRSDLAVEYAARIAHTANVPLILVGAYSVRAVRKLSSGDDDILGDDAYLIRGSNPADDLLRSAQEKATAYGVSRITRIAVAAPLHAALLTVAAESRPRLFVVADHDIGTRKGRWLGTLSRELHRKTGHAVHAITPADDLLVLLQNNTQGSGIWRCRRPVRPSKFFAPHQRKRMSRRCSPRSLPMRN
ncbi:universal stress protein [Nocardia sp. BMG51109]|uniref:universal stress protein n=1 Tax=Nocardia sp. BMG51109 TaxID=1056816 RepID=UPI000A009EEC